MPADEGDWQLGVIGGDDFASTDFGQHAPTSSDDSWESAATSVQPVFERACVRLAQQVAEVCAGERPLTNGVLLGEAPGKLLTAPDGAGAAELAYDGTRVRRPVEFRVIYDGGSTVGPLFAKLATGYGSTDTFSIDCLGLLGTAPMRLVKVLVHVFSGTPGLATLRLLDSSEVEIATTDYELVSGVNEIDFLADAGDHEVDAGEAALFTIESTGGQDGMGLLLQFEEVPL